jgi:hypothetical protein
VSVLNGLSRFSGMIKSRTANGDGLCGLAQSLHGPETKQEPTPKFWANAQSLNPPRYST